MSFSFSIWGFVSALWYIQPQTYYAALALFLSGVLCSAAGIGGGGIVVPVLIFCGGLEPHDAIPVSKFIVFLGAMASTLYSCYSATQSKRPADVDYNVALLVVPVALLGTLLGVWLNWIAQPHHLLAILAIILVVVCIVTAKAVYSQWCEENASMQREGLPDVEDHRHRGVDAEVEETPLVVPSTTSDLEQMRRCNTIAPLIVLLMSVVLTGVIHRNLLDCRAAKHNCKSQLIQTLFGTALIDQLHLPSTGIRHHLLLAFPIGLCSLLCIGVFGINLKKAKVDRFSPMTQLLFPFIVGGVGLATGILAGLVGIGGGLIFSPFFVVLGMNPGVAVATSTFCVLFTSLSTTLQYTLLGRIFLPRAFLWGSIFICASLLGTHLIHELQRKYPMRKSYVTSIIFFGVFTSVILVIPKLIALMMLLMCTRAANACT